MHCSCKDIKASESRSVEWAEIVPDEFTVFSWKTVRKKTAMKT